ncbi:MAG: DNA recombination protein RmuC [Burkholderiaceae bacterium]
MEFSPAMLAVVGVGLLALLLTFLALRGRRDGDVTSRLDALLRDNERLERELRAAVDASAGQTRLETGARLSEIQTILAQQMTGLTGLQGQQLSDLTQRVQLDLAEVRGTLQTQLSSLQQGNEVKLDQMRATVEEKLQSTLEARLGESFRMVSERLEQVHKGLGEMQALAAGVGDLKRVLTNVKARGTYGEVQLATLLEQVMLTDQYAHNVMTRPHSGERVEFAVRMPGRDHGAPCWLPIDAKFPVDDYERLMTAMEHGDAAALEVAGKALERGIKVQAKTIREKYVEPPHTTDFAIMFLPTEGLFAEVLRRPGLADHLSRECRTVIAGPTTLFAMLNSLQMGFRTLALERRSAEVWQVLGAVKTEFEKFGGVLTALQKQLVTASKTIDSAQRRSNQMSKALKSVEALPPEAAAALLPSSATDRIDH